jgi:hypothetical protein
MRRLLLLFIPFFLAQCTALRVGKRPQHAEILREGWIDCFEPGLMAGGRPFWCEASAVLYRDGQLLLANDKDMPDQRSALFRLVMKNNTPDSTVAPAYPTGALFKKAQKYEDFGLTPDGRYTLLVTGFDRVKPGSGDWDGFNSLLYWPTNDVAKAKVLSPNGSDSTSVGYRNKLARLLASERFPDGPPYFKVEGIAATGDKIYWGIREEGNTYEDFRYVAKIISVSYQQVGDALQLGDDFTLEANIDLAALQPTLAKPLGLSCIEYDPYRSIFWLLTSYENGEQSTGYLWTASLEELRRHQLRLMTTADGQPLRFAHKPEDLTLIDRHTLFILHDDDRVLTTVNGRLRQPQQTAYSVVGVR